MSDHEAAKAAFREETQRMIANTFSNVSFSSMAQPSVSSNHQLSSALPTHPEHEHEGSIAQSRKREREEMTDPEGTAQKRGELEKRQKGLLEWEARLKKREDAVLKREREVTRRERELPVEQRESEPEHGTYRYSFVLERGHVTRHRLSVTLANISGENEAMELASDSAFLQHGEVEFWRVSTANWKSFKKIIRRGHVKANKGKLVCGIDIRKANGPESSRVCLLCE
eukprot:236811_1